MLHRRPQRRFVGEGGQAAGLEGHVDRLLDEDVMPASSASTPRRRAGRWGADGDEVDAVGVDRFGERGEGCGCRAGGVRDVLDELARAASSGSTTAVTRSSGWRRTTSAWTPADGSGAEDGDCFCSLSARSACSVVLGVVVVGHAVATPIVVEQGGEGSGGAAEKRGAGEAARRVAEGQVRFEGGEAGVAVVAQRGARVCRNSPSPSPAGDHLAGRGDGVLDLEVFEVRPQHRVGVGERGRRRTGRSWRCPTPLSARRSPPIRRGPGRARGGRRRCPSRSHGPGRRPRARPAVSGC